MTCRDLISKIFTHPNYTGRHDINLFRRYRRKELEEFLSALNTPPAADTESTGQTNFVDGKTAKTNN